MVTQTMPFKRVDRDRYLSSKSYFTPISTVRSLHIIKFTSVLLTSSGYSNRGHRSDKILAFQPSIFVPSETRQLLDLLALDPTKR